MKPSFKDLLDNIDSFIRRYYLNKLIKGILLFVSGLLLSFFITISLEYFFEFNKEFRKFLFFTYFTINTIILLSTVIIPWLYFTRIIHGINKEKAAIIIGRYFVNINDQLTNTLQLKSQINQNNTDLVEASILQKIKNVNSNQFSKAIKLKDNIKFLPYLMVIILTFIVTYFVSPNFLVEPTNRIINYSSEYKPFYFKYNTENYTIEEGKNVEVKVELVGKKIPNQVFIESSLGKFLMKKVQKNVFTYTFIKVKSDVKFRFYSQDYYSNEIKINVYGRAIVNRYDAHITYPKYLNMNNEKIKNFGNIQAPEGSQIKFIVSTKNTENNRLTINNKKVIFKESIKQSVTLKNDVFLKLLFRNAYSGKEDSLSNEINVIKDLYPIISVKEKTDSLINSRIIFNGFIEDDYGLTGLIFNYKINQKDRKVLKVKPVNGMKTKFQFAVDFSNLPLKPEDKVSYWFTVSDNDGFNGPKSTNSAIKEYKVPSVSDVINKRDTDQENASDNLNTLKNNTKELEEKIKNLNKDLLQQNGNNWNNSEKIKQLKEDYKKLFEEINNTKQMLKESIENKNKLSEIDKELLEKQELLDKLLEEIMDEEMKKLLKELEDLIKTEDPEDIKDKMEEIRLSNEQMKEKLDRSLELLKKNRVNEKIDDIENKLKELSKKQDELREKNQNIKQEEKINEQNKINEEFNAIKEDIKKLKELNRDLERPMELGDPEEKANEINDKLQEAKENLEQGKTQKAKKSQKSSSGKMEELAEQLNAMQAQSNQEQNQEDIQAMRELLQNLISLSISQEKLMIELDKTNSRSPIMEKKGRSQKKIYDNSQMIIDSLIQLAKRQPSIGSFIDKEVDLLEKNLPMAVKGIGNRNKREISRSQQKIMTSFNNLALMLNESLNMMQQQMQNQMEGSGQCKNPGGGRPKPSPGGTGDMKEMLKKQLEQLKNGKKNNGKQNGNKEGDIPGLGSKEIAKMAAEQSAIRKKLEEIRNNLKGGNNELGNNLSELLNELEKQEKDLVNRRFKNIINRQKNILTRLLDSEKALNERGMEEKRESKTAKKQNQGNNLRIDQYNKEKIKSIEDIRTIDPRLNKYYKEKAVEYLNN